ncbi:MAG: hypothetical protein K2H19_09350, partial [Ruminococcus sp.]|nr:hypothetical protein [Ruminococcus sp.]
MKTKIILLSMSVAFLLSGCAQKSESNIIPLMNLEWFSEVIEVKNQLTDYDLLEEREGFDEDNHQDLLDYSGTELFETDCDLTLCFIEHGLVGFNYHDVKKNNNYREWFEKIETIYGVPTESGSGMASWYDDPVGKSTALYLFNLEEGVQISFYVTSNTPDKSYSEQSKGSIYVPTPELRTPIVPVIDDKSENKNDSVSMEAQTSVVTSKENKIAEIIGENSEKNNEIQQVQTSDLSSETKNITDKNSSTGTTLTSTSVSSALTTTVTTVQNKEEFKQDVLQFYATPEFERRRMSMYNQVYEYKTEEAGQPWELIMQYENVPYCNKKCDAVLC